MDRFNDDASGLIEFAFVSEVEIGSPLEPDADSGRLYPVIVKGYEGGVNPVTLGLMLTSSEAAAFSARFLRTATQACDQAFATAWMVNVTESVDEMRQHLSQHLGHEHGE